MLPLIEHIIQITIVDDSCREECEAECGIDWSSPEALALASQRIRDRFGDGIEITYLDISEAVTDDDALKWSKEIKDKNLSLPLLLVNGQLRIPGNFDIRQLLDVVEVEIEIGV